VSERSRYDTLDLFRVVSVWGIVLLHVHLVRFGSYEDQVIRMRDFALPVLIMASFFVMAISFDRYPHRPFGDFLRGRILRILAPSVAWSLIYWCAWWTVRPLLTGDAPVLPPLALPLTSYLHLWYLHFIFISAVLLAPVFVGVARGYLPRHPLALAALAVALLVMSVVQPWLVAMTTDELFGRAGAIAYPAPDWETCVSRVAPYLGYAPLGVALGLWHRHIARLHTLAWFGRAALTAALLMFAVHMATPGQPFTRPVFALAVFVAILRPIGSMTLAPVRRLAAWTYVIYILHFGFVVAAVAVLDRLQIPRSAASSLATSVIVFGVSLGTGVLLRKLPGAGFFLPLVPVASAVSSRADTSLAADASVLRPQPTSPQ
jgi:peptidoglycan/LPS O-acetylase OafA/YrhL